MTFAEAMDAMFAGKRVRRFAWSPVLHLTASRTRRLGGVIYDRGGRAEIHRGDVVLVWMPHMEDADATDWEDYESYGPTQWAQVAERHRVNNQQIVGG